MSEKYICILLAKIYLTITGTGDDKEGNYGDNQCPSLEVQFKKMPYFGKLKK